MSKMIVVVNYDTGNVKSIVAALQVLGFDVHYSDNKDKILKADAIVLPGVGAFKYGMEKLHKKGLVDVITNFVQTKRTVLGICLGMQLLADEGHEFGIQRGLGFIEGQVISLRDFGPSVNKLTLPHVGWNTVSITDKSEYLPIPSNDCKQLYYFLHSYALKTSSTQNVLAYTEYSGICFPSIIQKDNVIGMQFHPEKSGEIGLNLLKKVLIE